MKTRLFPKDQRGTANRDRLQANFSFSFGNFYNNIMVQFGILRMRNGSTMNDKAI